MTDLAGRERVLRYIKDIFWAVAAAGLVAGVGRFVVGLGASTNMMDALPWGWWKIFNMVAGAALATSGFIVAAIIYILQLEKYRPVARLSVVVGFLGYGASLVALLFDIGLPHRGWHPFFMWNPHSFLFEVFWCVSIYWGVTALELLPIVTERFALRKITHWLHEKMLPFVVLGITLSTMHHSSLGSLFMASPTRLHPLWHSLWIPPEFFISAMGGGIGSMILLKVTVDYFYGREQERKVLAGLAYASTAFLVVFLGLLIADFTVTEKWNFVFGPDLTWESRVYWVEKLLQVIVPIVCFIPAARLRNIPLMLVGASAAFFGLIMHRVDTGIVGYFRSSEAVYIPNMSELVVSFGVLAAAGLFFFLLIDKFNVLDEPEGAHGHHDEDDEDEEDEPEANVVPGVKPWTREELVAMLISESAFRAYRIFVIMIPLAGFALRDQATGKFEPIRQPVSQAVLAANQLRTGLTLDANRNGMVTAFPHKRHWDEFEKIYELEEEKDTCVKCHHLSLPKDANTSCRRCHQDMEISTPMFNPERHATRFKDEKQRAEFESYDLEKRAENFKACMICHKDNMLGLAAYVEKGFDQRAPGFKHAMHGSCLTCHRLREQEKKDDLKLATSRGNCLYCHRDWADEGMFKDAELAKAMNAEPLPAEPEATSESKPRVRKKRRAE